MSKNYKKIVLINHEGNPERMNFMIRSITSSGVKKLGKINGKEVMCTDTGQWCYVWVTKTQICCKYIAKDEIGERQ